MYNNDPMTAMSKTSKKVKSTVNPRLDDVDEDGGADNDPAFDCDTTPRLPLFLL